MEAVGHAGYGIEPTPESVSFNWCSQPVAMQEGAVGFRRRRGQVEAVYKVVVGQQDQLLIAPPGWGKSVVSSFRQFQLQAVKAS